MSIVINPGTGPVPGATLEQARANMDAFCADLREAGVIATTITLLQDDHDGDGRYAYRLGTGDARQLDVLMPGIPLDEVRIMASDGQNPWAFPRLYVDGSSWLWVFALKACEPPEGYVRPTAAELGHGDPFQDHPNPDQCGDPNCDC